MPTTTTRTHHDRSSPVDRGYERDEGYQGGQSGWSSRGAYQDRDTPARRHHIGDHWTDRGPRPEARDERERGGWGEPYGDGFGGYGHGWGGWQQSGREGQRLDRGADDDDRHVVERGRHAGKGPRGWRRSDERIAEDINERLTDHPDVDAGDIEVKVEAGEVTLSGTVDSRRTRRLAEDLALEVAGVHDVQNSLRVLAARASAPDRS